TRRLLELMPRSIAGSCATLSPLVICSIVTRSELPYARALAARLAELDPAAGLTALVVDAGRPLENEPNLELLHLQAIAPEVGLEVFGYDASELKARVAPSLVRHALDLGRSQAVVLLDHQVDVHAPLDDVLALAAEHGIVLVPRLLERLPDDGARP